MKKIFSSILALAMTLSLFTFTAHAGTNAYYDVSYEAISVASGDINKLAEGDMFWAVVTLKNATGIFGGGVSFTWDSEKLQLSNSAGNANKVFAVVTGDRIVSTQTTTGMDMNTGEMGQVPAFEASTSKATESSLEYEFSAAQVYDENGEDGYYDYPLSGDVVVFKARFKVLKAEDPEFTFTQKELRQSKAGTLVSLEDSSFAKLGFASAGSETETKYFAATLNWGVKAKASTGVEFSFAGADNTAKVPFNDFTIEDASDVTVGLEVTDVPSDATLTLSNVDWY